MKEKIKKIFATILLPIVFSNHFPFLTVQTKQKEEKVDIVKDQLAPREENPEKIHPEYSVGVSRNSFVVGITSTATVISDFIHNIFYPKK